MMWIKLKHSYQNNLVKKGGNSILIGTQKITTARLYKIQSGSELTVQYLPQSGRCEY